MWRTRGEEVRLRLDRYIYFGIACRYSDEELTAVEIVKSHLALQHGCRELSVTREVLVRWLEEEPRPGV